MAIAYTIMRVALGLNIFMHGFTRYQTGIGSFQEALEKEFTGTILPVPLVGLFGRSLPALETIIGALLIAGLFSQAAIIAGSLVMLVLIFGKSVKGDWQVVSLQMIYVAFYSALGFLTGYNTLSADYFFKI